MDYLKLEAWRLATLNLAKAKDEEMKLRKELFLNFASPVEGANSLELAQGWVLKATVPYTRSLDQTKAAAVLKELKKMKAPADLIKVKYELGVTEYRKLPSDLLALVNTVLTTKPGTPALELIPPKGM